MEAEWWRDSRETGAAVVVPEQASDSGLFRFFDGSNWEILIKVLDGCRINDHFWVYGASTTDLGYSIRVTDTATGEVKEYRNEAGRPAPAIGDDKAFAQSCRQ